jgi:hypothetical protein
VSWNINRLAAFVSRRCGWREYTLPTETQSAIGLAAFTCLTNLLMLFWVARPAVDLLEIWWAKALVYALVPIASTFIVLYRSSWQHEIIGAPRTCSLLLVSCAIFCGVLFAMGLAAAIACFLAIAFGANEV